MSAACRSSAQIDVVDLARRVAARLRQLDHARDHLELRAERRVRKLRRDGGRVEIGLDQRIQFAAALERVALYSAAKSFA